jgi:ATP-dependent helicase/nuclease subunit B
MAAIAQARLDPGLAPAALWDQLAQTLSDWCAVEGVALRDTVLLLPYAALLPPARAAFARRAAWPPRIETALTLADSLAPPGPATLGDDPAEDRLAAVALLLQEAGGSAWQAQDARGFADAAQALAQAAARLAEGAAACAPAERPAWWQAARRAVAAGAGDGPGALEQALLRVALAWAVDAPAPATDALFEHPPAAWAVLQAGGPDPLAQGLLQAWPGPALWLDADADPADPFAAIALPTAPVPTELLCAHFEAEAQAAAAEVIDALSQGLRPVGLVALDRELVRRTRALLERAGVALLDETGWRLSTTRAGARVMAWLRAAQPEADDDERLAWLQAWPAARAQPAVLRQVEASWRRSGRAAVAAHPLWRAAQAALAPLAVPAQPLAAWCQALGLVLRQAGEWAGLAQDAAGLQVLQVLRLEGGSPRWQALAGAVPMRADDFIAWVDAELEGASFSLPATSADVVLTPLSRALLRPFACVVVPGLDARHLAGSATPPGLVGEALATTLGLETAPQRQRRERLALAQLLRVPDLRLLRRRLDGDEPLAASPALQALALRRAQAGLPPLPRRDPAGSWQQVQPQPVARPLPVAPQALPDSLSASQLEQLRRCPYQFFARTLLRLSVPEELDREVEKRDYGTWLHAVLHRFHASGGGDAARLSAVAEEELAQTGFAASDLLPYRASFEHFAPLYLAWWQAQAAAGWSWREGETEFKARPAELAPTGLHGRLDRLDQAGEQALVIDYKTGRAEQFKRRLKTPAEDTQLAFYAALLAPHWPGPLAAAYLTLDDADAPELLQHPEVQQTAQTLLAGVGDELQRLRAGAPLPALGEGAACEHCEVRGLCRRDQWGPA